MVNYVLKKSVNEAYTNYEMLKFWYKLKGYHSNCLRAPYVNFGLMKVTTFQFPSKPMIELKSNEKNKLILTETGEQLTPITKLRQDGDVICKYIVPFDYLVPDVSIKLITSDDKEGFFWPNIYVDGRLYDDRQFVIDLKMFTFPRKYQTLLFKDSILMNINKCSYLPLSLLKTYTRVAVRLKNKSFMLPYVSMNNVFRNIEVDPEFGVSGIIVNIPEGYHLLDNNGDVVKPATSDDLEGLPSNGIYNQRYVIPYWMFMQIMEYSLDWVVVNDTTGERKNVTKEMSPEALMRFRSRLGKIYRWLHIRLDL